MRGKAGRARRNWLRSATISTKYARFWRDRIRAGMSSTAFLTTWGPPESSGRRAPTQPCFDADFYSFGGDIVSVKAARNRSPGEISAATPGYMDSSRITMIEAGDSASTEKQAATNYP